MSKYTPPTPAGLRAIADRLSADITVGHDWPNTQDELDRLGAADALRHFATAHTELRELAKLAYRALCDAEAVINTIDGECVLETVKLSELQERIGDCALHLFTVLGLPTSELRGGA